ncbi:hypothetical protein PGAG_00411 [Phaeocystis globosa virus 12T]|uniref:Uncharacterized protein n=1 Tax=Phaeocystis globosa virus PgV-16T TaxID=3071227 RepID=A0AC59EWK9_9VIRU|nr:hypothetical protein PGCG_00025 [Phaeocystis globosa virus]AET72865.1 hypothetical protein PGAG_00411 [Phaeocystis globosa virus 12T]AET73638.1 hypothetical protein PGBG_00422 [Phaeocystis globosa virus 14T]AGM15337.1 hypothetical protein PGCG_00025 [Phaeocystis globosa virus PgV-16T]UYE94067.1 PAP2 superfamily protein [Phaeocystis globosa virus]
MPDTPDSIRPTRKAAAITFTLTNLFTYTTLMSPFFLTFFMVMLSIVNNTIVKGLLFLVGLAIVSFLVYLLKTILQEKQSALASPLCNILPMPFTVRGNIAGERTVFSSPILSPALLGYISSYLIFPMYINNDVNHPLLVFLLAMFGSNSMVEYSNKCGSVGSIVLGGILGIAFGIMYYGLLVSSGHKDLAYFSEIKSNAQGCKKPTDQKFKCVTYKRGERPVW